MVLTKPKKAGGGHDLPSRASWGNMTACLMSTRIVRSLFVRRVLVGVSVFPNPATKSIAFISGGELRTRWDQNPVLDFSFPQLRVLPLLPSYRICGPCIGGMFYSPATILSFIGQILTSWRRDLIREWILRTHHRGILFVDFVAPWGQRNSRLTRSARLRNHETRLCEEQGARGAD